MADTNIVFDSPISMICNSSQALHPALLGLVELARHAVRHSIGSLILLISPNPAVVLIS